MSRAPAPAAGPRVYFPGLDTLRFCAFAMVFAHHSLPGSEAYYLNRGFPPLLASICAATMRFGAAGVDLFFVLSAYLITLLLVRENQAHGGIHVAAFYARRALRIWPLYYGFLALCLAGRGILPGENLTLSYAAAFALLAGNWICSFQSWPASSAAPLWSVSLEEQFYLVWPLLLKFTGAAVRRLRLIAVAMFLLAAAWRWYIGAGPGARHDIVCDTFARLDALAAGILAATFPKARLKHGLLWLAAAAAAACYIWESPLGATPPVFIFLRYPAAALAATAALLVFAHRPAPPGLAGRLLPYLGKISYGLYVFHALALALAAAWLPQAIPGYYYWRVVLGALLTLSLAALSYRFFESPFLRWKQRFTFVPSRPV